MANFDLRRDVQAPSHINVVVEDIEIAIEFYHTVLGFERASNANGPIDSIPRCPNLVEDPSFAEPARSGH